jgi:transposase
MSAKQSSDTDKALKLVKGGMTPYAAAKKVGIALSTIYRAVKRHVEVEKKRRSKAADEIERLLAENAELRKDAEWQWVELTDDEIKDIVGRNDPGGIGRYTRDLFKKIEDKLREKNG